jgi:hypothetical protein
MSLKTAGRLIAIIMIAQAPIAPIVNFVLVGPVMKAPGFLLNAVTHTAQMRLAAMLWLLTGALAIGIAAIAVSVLRKFSDPMATWLLSVSVAGFVTTIAEAACFLTMVSVSQQYAEGGGSLETYQALAKSIGSGRGWIHYTNLLLAAANGLVLNIGLFRFSLVPRALSGCGVLAATLGAIGMIRPMIGYSQILQLLTPLGIAQLSLLLWLLLKGFRDARNDTSVNTANS